MVARPTAPPGRARAPRCNSHDCCPSPAAAGRTSLPVPTSLSARPAGPTVLDSHRGDSGMPGGAGPDPPTGGPAGRAATVLRRGGTIMHFFLPSEFSFLPTKMHFLPRPPRFLPRPPLFLPTNFLGARVLYSETITTIRTRSRRPQHIPPIPAARPA